MINHRQMPMPLQPKVKHVWAHGFFIGLVLGALGFFVYYFGTTIPFFPPTDEKSSQTIAEAESEQAPPAKPEIIPTTPAEPVVDLQEQLTRIFNGIRQTNLEKNLERLMGFYSPKFPGLSKRTQSISESWRLFDYEKMEFKIHEIHNIGEDSAVAWVTWDVALKELSTSKIKNVSKTYKVTFIKESGQWYIIGLKNALW